MSDTTYVDYTTPPVNAAWLNEVNDHVWHSTPVNGTTVHPASSIGFQQVGTGATTRTVQDELRDVLNVKQFGAVGDGIIDDTSAIQAAINSIPSNNSSAHAIYFPTGMYKVTSITATGRAVTLTGDGPLSSTILATQNSDVITIDGTGLTNSDVCSISNLGVVESTNLTGMTGIKVKNISNIYLENLFIRTSSRALEIGSSSTPDVNFSMLNQIRIEAYGATEAIRLRCGGGCWSNIFCRKFRTQGVTGPTVWITGQVTSLQVSNCAFGGKGTAKRTQISSITSTASNFTVNATAHGHIAGEMILITGTSTGYDGTWQITSRTADAYVVTSNINLGTVTPTTAYTDKLHACLYFDNTLGPVNETSWSNILLEGIDDGGSAGGTGSVALYLDCVGGNNAIQDHNFSNLFCDVGQIAIHGMGKHIGNGEILCHGLVFNNLDLKFVRYGVNLHECKGIQFSNVKTTCVRSQGTAKELLGSSAIRLDGLGYHAITGIQLNGGHWGRQPSWRTDQITNFTPDYGIRFGGYVQDIHLNGSHFYGQTSATIVDTWGTPDPASRIIDNGCTYASGVGESSATRIPTIASAGTINIPFGDIFIITGTATIYNITNFWVGRKVTLLITGAASFATGGNIGNALTTVANQLVMAVSDGTLWHLR